MNTASIDWITPVFTLLGVALGALLTPYASSRIENAKVKRAIPAVLLKHVYSLFNLLKVKVSVSNCNGLRGRRGVYLRDLLAKEGIEGSKRKDLEWELGHIKDNIDKDNELLSKNSDMIISVESELIAAIYQVQAYCGMEVFQVIYNLVKAPLEESNKNCLFYDYQTLKEEQFKKLDGGELTTQIDEKEKALDKACSTLLQGIQSKF